MKKIQLENFKLCGQYPFQPLKTTGAELGNMLMPCTDWLNVKVPHGIYNTLESYGLIKDVNYQLNSLSAEWVANRWWQYLTTFNTSELFNIGNNCNLLDCGEPSRAKINSPAHANCCKPTRVEIVLEGVDGKCYVRLNNKIVAEHNNTFTPCIVDITSEYIAGENVLEVIFESAQEGMSQCGKTDSHNFCKPRFGYKWDFCARLVNLGIYKKVFLNVYYGAKIDDYYFNYLGDGKSEIQVNLSNLDVCIKNLESKQNESIHNNLLLNISLKYNGENVYGKSFEVSNINTNNPNANFKTHFNIDKPQLWYPSGSGQQPLYDLTIEVLKGGKVCDVIYQKVGLKTIRLEKNVLNYSSNDALGYTFTVNGQKIYIQGVNITPLDMQYGIVTQNRYEELLKILKESNVNLIRVWGGGIIESEEFYQLCDKLGFLVWQEFTQSGSAVSSVPNKNPIYLDELKNMAEFACKTKRNHVSLCLWSGGNELLGEDLKPVTFSDINIAALSEKVSEFCPQIPMLPSSASGNNEMADPLSDENHDVHGYWKYLGTENHYHFYNNLNCLFHSEFGVDGMCDYSSLLKFLSKENLIVTDMAANQVWRAHGEWWDTLARDEGIFGKMYDLQEFITVSQWVQAEGLRYILESNRRKAFYNSGQIVWQANEPYPNVSCTSLIDYYLHKKPALKSVEKAFSAINVSARYDKLVFEQEENIVFSIFATCHYDTDLNVSVKVVCGNSEEFNYNPAKRNDNLEEKSENKVLAFNNFNVRLNKDQAIELKKYELTAFNDNIFIHLSAQDGRAEYNNTIVLLVKNREGFCNKNFIIGGDNNDK